MDPLARRFSLAAATSAPLGLVFGGAGVAALYTMPAGDDPMTNFLRPVVAVLTFGPGAVYLAAAVGLWCHRRGAVYVGLVMAALNGAHGTALFLSSLRVQPSRVSVVDGAWVAVVGLLLWQLIGLLKRMPSDRRGVPGFDVLPPARSFEADGRR